MSALIVLRFGATAAPAHADSNGCGPDTWWGFVIPNKPLGNDFTDACNWHDNCYSQQQGKAYCDPVFVIRMYDWCNNNGGTGNCYWAADLYSDKVDDGGAEAYRKAGENPSEDSAFQYTDDGTSPYGDGSDGDGRYGDGGYGGDGSDGGHGDGGGGYGGGGGGYGGGGGCTWEPPSFDDETAWGDGDDGCEMEND